MADRPNRISTLRKGQKLTQQELAEKLGTHWITLSKLERGTQKLTWPWMQKIAEALDVPVHQLVSGDESIATVWVGGSVDEDGALSEYEEGLREKRLVFGSIFDDTYNDWFEIQGDTLWPFFKRGDLIGCTRTEKDSENYINRLVIFKSDEDQEFRAGILGRGSENCRYNLQFGSGRPLIDTRGVVTHYVATAIFEAPLIAPERVIINQESQQDIKKSYEARQGVDFDDVAKPESAPKRRSKKR